MTSRKHHWRFLGSSNTKHVAKILLEYLDPPGKPLECYRLYLKNAVSFHFAQRSVSMMNQDLLEKFYRSKEVLEHPKYFPLFDAVCVSKLEHVINKRIVLLMAEGKDSFRKLHDKRVYDRLKREGELRVTEVLYFVLEHGERDKCWKLYEISTEMDKKLYVQLQTELSFFDPKTLKVAREGDCLLEVVGRVLGRQLSAQHVHGPECLNLRELVFSTRKSDLARELGAEFYLVSHLRTSPTAWKGQRHTPKNNLFGVHAIFDLRDSSSVGIADMEVVAVTHNLRFYRLDEKFAQAVKFAPARQRQPKREQFPAPGDRLQQHQQAQQREGRRRVKVARQVDEDAEVHQVETCPCGGCRSAGKFSENMSFNGSQQKFHCDLSSFDLFRLLGKFDEKVEEDLMRLCRLSVASFDVESMATHLPDEVGNEDLANLNVETTSKTKLPRQVTAVQEPVRIGFTDQARMESGLPTLVFRHDPLQPTAMVAQFVDSMFDHRDETVSMKHEILHPYFQWLETYKKKHYEFFAGRGWLPPEYAQKWQNFQNWTPDEADDDDQSQQGLDLEEEALLRELARDLGEGNDGETSSSCSRKRSPSPDLASLSSSDESEAPAAGVTASAEEDQDPLPPHLSTFFSSAQADDDDKSSVAVSEQGLAGIAAAKKLKRDREARRVADVELSWRHGVFGILEARLRYLSTAYQVFGYNCESYDLVILCSQLAVYCKETNRKDIFLHKQGSKIRWMKLGGILICELKRLASPGFSLAALGAACQLEEVKFIFPFSKFTSLSFLDLPSLPSDAGDWTNDLNPNYSPSQDAVDAARSFYAEKRFQNIGQYLEFYLDLDVVILQKSVVAMAQVYYAILGLNIIDSRKLTVSSLASCGAQTYLARGCRPCQTFPNHQRIYSILKKSLRGGLTTMTRSVSGKHANLDDYVDLLKRQMEEGGEDGGPDLELCDRVAASGLDLPSYISHCNAHLLEAGTTHPAVASVYLDVNSLYAASARDGLPYLGAILYDEESPLEDPPDGDLGKVRLSRNYGRDKELRPNMADAGESLCAQYLLLCAFPTASYVASNFHAGQSCVSLGSNWRRKADVMISVPEDEPEMLPARRSEDVEYEPDCWRRGDWLPARRARSNRRQFLRFFQYHGSIYHGDGLCLPDCPKRLRREAAEAAEAEAGAQDEEVWKKKKRDRALPDLDANVAEKRPKLLHPATAGLSYRDDEDQLKTEYVAAMSEVDPEHLVLTFSVIHECRMMHESRPPDPAQWNSLTSGGKKRKAACDAWRNYATVREYLKCEHKEDSVLGLRQKRFTQKSLLDKIKSTGYNSVPGQDYGGFVCLTGGREAERGDGLLRGSFGFCHQRSRTSLDQVGSFTKFQAAQQHGGSRRAGREDLERLLKEPRTVVKTSFPEEEGEVISLDYLRFLLDERKLEGFRIRHLVFYRVKRFLDPFITGMIQRRHTLRKVKGSELLSLSLKLVVNGLYGYAAVESCSFDRTRVVAESTLGRYKYDPGGLIKTPGLNDGDLSEVALLGAVRREGKVPDLLYAITSHQPKKNIFNTVQISANILSQSRCIYLGKILAILRYFDPGKVEVTYADTDSCILAVASTDLQWCLRPQYEDQWDAIAGFLLEDPSSETEQSGYFKIEGAWEEAYMRSSKAYYLSNKNDQAKEDIVRRLRSIPRKHHQTLGKRLFGQDPNKNHAVVRGLQMGPTAGLQVLMAVQGKTLAKAFNLTRQMVDCCHSVALE